MARDSKNDYDAGLDAGIAIERCRIATWIEALAAKYFIEKKDDLAARFRELSFWVRKPTK